jgi:hypothetical protein
MKIKHLIAIVLCGMLFSCTKNKVVVNHTEVSLDSLRYVTYADTIVCDMVVKSPDKEDKILNEWLSRLNRVPLIDTIFMDVYNGKLIATDYETHKVLSIDEVKKIEQSIGNNRDRIGKFQFKESWHYDKENHSFIKKVQSIIFGYEIYDDSGFATGYKPLFRVQF